MRPASEWRDALSGCDPAAAGVTCVEGRSGLPTIKCGGILLHSQYQPREEARRLVDSAGLDPARPVVVAGLGAGYHVAELLERGFELAVVEPSPAVACLALDLDVLPRRDFLLGAGPVEELAHSVFREVAARIPQVFVHPPTARLHPGYAEAVEARLVQDGLAGERLSIAVVGPMYGGSLEIAQYLERAFAKLGHRTLFVDNRAGYSLYRDVANSVEHPHASGQLTNLLVNVLGEWSYARVMEFMPDLCIVVAQAPVDARFPARLRKEGIVTAFWYIENWRHLPYWQTVAPHYDTFFHIQPGEFEQQLEAAGCADHAYVQTACDPEVHRPVTLTPEEQEEYGSDISFAGAGYYNRQQLFAGLTDYRFRIWGVGWHKRELAPVLRRPEQRFSTEEFLKIVAGARINLNLHASTACPGVDPGCDAINPRVFEIAACGGFQLCDPCAGLDRMFDFDRELPVYRNIQELRALIDRFLANPSERREFAERARARVLAEHTYVHRARQMLELLLERHGARILRKGIRIQRTMGEMTEMVGRGDPLGQFLATLPPAELFTQDAINRRLGKVRADASRPERIFQYLHEVRNYTEGLLGLRKEPVP